MKLIYVTLRNAQMPPMFHSYVYPALVDGLALPRNYKAIKQPGLVQALEDALGRVKNKPSEAAIVTNAAGDKTRITELLGLVPNHLAVSIITIDSTGSRNVARLQLSSSRRNICFFDIAMDKLQPGESLTDILGRS